MFFFPISGFMMVNTNCLLHFVMGFLICIINGNSTIKEQEVLAIQADLFVESIGVNAHWASVNVYTYNYTGLKGKLGESGIRYIRDGTCQVNYTTANDLYHSLGIKTNIVTGHRCVHPNLPLDLSQIDEVLDEIKTQALAAAVSLEGPNEYDLSHGSDTDWITKIQNYTSLLYMKVKADELLRHLPVIGPSLTSEDAYEAVGNEDPFIDYSNLHLYQGRRWPGNNGSGEHGYGSITWFFNYLVRFQSPSGKAIQATEAGYHNLVLLGGISEEAEGKYTARMYAEFFRRGIVRTYKYELVNEENKRGKEGTFGLLRSDISEKPAFKAIKNLITILNDKGPDFSPDSLNYVFDGSVDDMKQILFQKRNGDFYLMIWLEVPSWDIDTAIDLYPPPQQVLLTLLNNHNISSATLYAFNNTADINTFMLPINNNQLTLNVTDKINIIKLTNRTNSMFDYLY